MSILASLVRAYQRLNDPPPFGYSVIGVDFCIVLTDDGTPALPPVDLRTFLQKKKTGKLVAIGRPTKLPTPLAQRTSGISPNFMWDKSAYCLAVSATSKRPDEEHEAFVREHYERLAGIDDEGIRAFLLFLRHWHPDHFKGLSWPTDMIDANIVFALEGEHRSRFIHQREPARTRWEQVLLEEQATIDHCLVTGSVARIARSHPPLKGVTGAQSSGAFLVSFNGEAFTSYGHEQGDNAPVSEAAAFQYATVLNTFLAGIKNRIQIGDASTVFWADAEDSNIALLAEATFHGMVDTLPEIDEAAEAEKVRAVLTRIRAGEQWDSIAKAIDPGLQSKVRFSILGLAPNAARIAVRYWFQDDFGVLATNYQHFLKDTALSPGPRTAPNLWALALRTAPARKDDKGRLTFEKKNISRQLVGDLFRSLVTGQRFPGALLPTLLMRVRSDGILDGARAMLIKAAVVRDMRLSSRLPREDYLVRSDPDDPNDARRLGRLFALVERAQLAALGDKLNTTVKDKYLGTAAATPRQIVTTLVENAERHHLKRLRNGHSDADWIKDAAHARRVGAALNRDIGRIYATFNNGFPAQHSNEEQGLFMVGYYQERFGMRGSDDGGAPADMADGNDNEGDEDDGAAEPL